VHATPANRDRHLVNSDCCTMPPDLAGIGGNAPGYRNRSTDTTAIAS